MVNDCKKCAKHRNFSLNVSPCPNCRVKVYGEGNKKCKICHKISKASEFNGHFHTRCKYLRDKRLASGGVLVTISERSS